LPATDWFLKIKSLASQSELLNLKGVFFKFLIPSELMSEAAQALPFTQFPPCTLHWGQAENKWDMRKALQQRISLCCSDAVLEFSESILSSLCRGRLAKIIDNQLISFGELTGSPRAMLLLGHYLLDHHYRETKIVENRLVEIQSLAYAYFRYMNGGQVIELTDLESSYVEEMNELKRELELVTQIRTLIKEGLEDALVLFEQLDLNEAIATQSQISLVEQDWMRELITKEERDIKYSRIVRRLIIELSNFEQKVQGRIRELQSEGDL
jgi:hypothetical protein